MKQQLMLQIIIWTMVKLSDILPVENSPADNQSDVQYSLESSTGWLSQHVSIELKHASDSDNESRGMSPDIADDRPSEIGDEQDCCQKVSAVVEDGLSQSITIVDESEPDDDNANTSGHFDIPYLVRYNVPFHVLETNDTHALVKQESAGAVQNVASNMTQPEEQPSNFESDNEKGSQQPYTEDDLQEVLQSFRNSSKENIQAAISHDGYGEVRTASPDDANGRVHVQTPDWVKEKFQTPTVPPNSPMDHDILDNCVEGPVALTRNNTNIDGQANFLTSQHLNVTTCAAEQKEKSQKISPHVPKKPSPKPIKPSLPPPKPPKPNRPPPTPPKPKLWKRYKRTIIKVSKERKSDEAKDLQRKDSSESLQENSKNVDSGNSTPQAKTCDGLVVPGVAPRKRSPRSLWKKYRKDMLSLSVDTDEHKVNENNKEKVCKSLLNVGGDQMHQITNEGTLVEPYPDEIPEPIVDVNFQTNLNKVNGFQNDVTEGDIWDTIEQKTSDEDHQNNSFQDHQLFEKVIENPPELRKSVDHELGPQVPHMNGDVVNNGCSYQSLNDTCNHPNHLVKNAPLNTNGSSATLLSRSGNSFSTEDIVILNANGITSLHIPNKDFPSPDGSPTNINVVDMVVIDVQGKTAADDQDFMLDVESGNPDSQDSTGGSFSSDELSNISRIISAYSPEESSRMSMSSLENSTDRYHKSLSKRRYSIDTSLPNRNGYNLDMSVCSAESEDLSVCSGETSGSGKRVLELVGKRRFSLSTNIDLQRNDSLLSNSEII